MKTIFSILSIFTYAFCFGQSDWTFVDSSVEDIEYYVKDVRKTSENDVYSLWVKAEYPDKKVKNKKGQWVISAGKYSVGSWGIHCGEKASKLERLVEYNGKGSVISDRSQDVDWNKIVPDSIAEAVFEFVCRKPD